MKLGIRAGLYTIALTMPVLSVAALEYSGRAYVSGLYQTDTFDSLTVAEVYDTASAPERLLGIAVGRDVTTECAQANRRCVLRKISSAGELDLERYTDAGTTTEGELGSDALLTNLGLNAKIRQNQWLGKIHGNLAAHAMEPRTLLGNKKFRFRFSELYGQYTSTTTDVKYRVSLGRKPVFSSILVDGVDAEWFFGPASAPDSQRVGLFAGLAPHPITKHPSKDFITFGPYVSFTPQLSQTSDLKFKVDSAFVTELYEGDLNRLYLLIKTHFTPIRTLSFLAHSTLEIPYQGRSFESSHSSFQATYRPNTAWVFSSGFSQFRADRFLREEAVRWVTDGYPNQARRVGETLDRSQRYRVDLRTSFRPIYEAEPFIKARYERRTFDPSKTFQNSAEATPTPTADLDLLADKNAFSLSPGLRLHFFEKLETESLYTLSNRFESSAHSVLQTATWTEGRLWTADAFFQYVHSKRMIDGSLPDSASTKVSATDLYFGVGGSLRFFSDFLAQIRYDLGIESDEGLGTKIHIHTVYGRVDYQF